MAEGGCPWDRSRKLEDCPKYIQGELDEVIEAIGSGNNADIEEELGDLLFMVAFTAKLAERDGRLEMKGVFKRILEKMVHPSSARLRGRDVGGYVGRCGFQLDEVERAGEGRTRWQGRLRATGIIKVI